MRTVNEPVHSHAFYFNIREVTTTDREPSSRSLYAHHSLCFAINPKAVLSSRFAAEPFLNANSMHTRMQKGYHSHLEFSGYTHAHTLSLYHELGTPSAHLRHLSKVGVSGAHHIEILFGKRSRLRRFGKSQRCSFLGFRIGEPEHDVLVGRGQEVEPGVPCHDGGLLRVWGVDHMRRIEHFVLASLT